MDQNVFCSRNQATKPREIKADLRGIRETGYRTNKTESGDRH